MRQNIWIMTGMIIFNTCQLLSAQVPHFSHYKVSDGLSQSEILCIYQESEGYIWFGTQNGLNKFDGYTFENFFNDPSDSTTISNNWIFGITEDQNGRFWIGTGNGICILDTKTKERSILTADGNGALTISRNQVYSILEDSDGEIWIAASNGLDRYDPATGEISQYTSDPGSVNTLCDNYTISLCEDRNGHIWVGTSLGISEFNKSESTFTNYSIKDGLPSNIIYDIIMDGNGNLWFTTGSGLAMKNPDAASPDVFTIVDELLGKEINLKAVYKNDRGELFFGAINGLISHTKTIRSPLNFQPLISPILPKTGIPTRWRAYPINGLRLGPGDYNFHLRGCNNDGVWNLSGESMRITIHPPWWRSRYAYVVYIIAIIVTIIIIIKGKQKNELNALNAMKDKFFSILAHDLKNPFSILYSLSGLVVQNFSNMEDSEKLTALEKIEESTEYIYSLLSNLLTWSQSQRGDIDYSPEKFILTNLIDLNINLHKISADKKGVRLVSMVSGEWQAYGDREMVSTVIRNLINNAIKYSHTGGQVVLNVTEKDDFLEVEVRDQGVGMSKESIKKIFRIDTKFRSAGTMGEKGTGLGLILCKDFVEMCGGQIWCESREGSGTTFHFTIPAAS